MAAGQHKGSFASALGAGEGEEGRRFDKLGTNGEGVSRRALLGAAVALPVLSFATGLGQARPLLRMSGEEGGQLPATFPGEERWRRALAAFERAEAAARALEGRAGESREEQFALEEAYGERLDVMYAMLRRLLRAPAPDLAALGLKIVLAVDHEVGTLWRGEACMAAVKRDALRLCCRMNL